jgi:hypothetical protein
MTSRTFGLTLPIALLIGTVSLRAQAKDLIETDAFANASIEGVTTSGLPTPPTIGVERG